MSSVYWIHHPEHTDMFSQGYIGVSKDLKRRFRNHAKRSDNPHLKNAINKYGWDNLVKQIILVADDAYCFMIEKALRSTDNIGWNIVRGGGNPPISRWNKGIPALPHVIEAVIKANTGRIHTKEEKEKRIKGLIGRPMSAKNKEALRIANMNRIPTMKGKHFPTVTCPHCNKVGGIIPMKRWHMNNCKLKEHEIV